LIEINSLAVSWRTSDLHPVGKGLVARVGTNGHAEVERYGTPVAFYSNKHCVSGQQQGCDRR
jgi:hypothetical protein